MACIYDLVRSCFGVCFSPGFLSKQPDTGSPRRRNTSGYFLWRRGLHLPTGSNVGIGEISPGEKLEVNGNIKLAGAAATYKITNVVDPTENQDVATKAYVDAQAGGCGITGGCQILLVIHTITM
ncbi:MAG: hypothetical protein U9M95_01410 [Candidatus Altiarchaeota archaeon]|nr:hypothetical protein [Candidatus Altiarchaeota archaeon]